MALFERGNSTRCDLCGADLGTTVGLDAHEGRHPHVDPVILKIGHMPHKKFKPHAQTCTCSECKRIRAEIAEQKKEHWATQGAVAA